MQIPPGRYTKQVIVRVAIMSMWEVYPQVCISDGLK